MDPYAIVFYLGLGIGVIGHAFDSLIYIGNIISGFEVPDMISTL